VKPLERPSPSALARVAALAERRLSAQEAQAALAVPLSQAEEEESRSLIRWFRRRYSTPAARLAYARRAYRRWASAQPAVGDDVGK
jgi:hypothetical protein